MLWDKHIYFHSSENEALYFGAWTWTLLLLFLNNYVLKTILINIIDIGAELTDFYN